MQKYDILPIIVDIFTCCAVDVPVIFIPDMYRGIHHHDESPTLTLPIASDKLNKISIPLNLHPYCHTDYQEIACKYIDSYD